MKVLIVEDRKNNQKAIEHALKEVLPGYTGGFELQTARWYAHAERLINDNEYDMVLLDHRMPVDEPACEESDVGYMLLLKPVGYGLIPVIRERSPKTVIVGISAGGTDSEGEGTTPDFRISKYLPEAIEEFREVMEALKAGSS